MEHYVTLFDSLFLPQGLALHRSMERHAKPYTLWVLCMDDPVFDALQGVSLPNVRPLQLSTLASEALQRAKATRTTAEYCWTCTPFTPHFVFAADLAVKRVTYIDADMWFRKNPGPIFSAFEASGKHVLITDHAYAAECDQSMANGQYCVQFMTFTRDGGEPVRKWWQDRCLEWCYARAEDGKFGDQKYLDDWPQRFPDLVHVLQDKELLLAPWNATRFPYGHSILWHFHGLRITLLHYRKSPAFIFANYPLPGTVITNIYTPYQQDLLAAIKAIKLYGLPVRPQIKLNAWSLFKLFANDCYHKLRLMALNSVL